MPRFATKDGLSLDYRDEGNGLPVLCLPGLTRDHRDFDDFAAAAPPDLRLIRLTPRGRGASDRDPDHRNYTVPVEAADALALLDHLAIPRAVLLGTSRGGFLAMLLALTARDRVAGVILNDVGPELAPAGLARIMDYLGRPPAARTEAELVDALVTAMGPAFPGLSRERWQSLARRWFDIGPDGIGLTYDPRLRDAVLEASALPAPDLWPWFDALAGLPAALIRGARSDLLTAETAAAMKARNPDLILAEVPDRGHVPFLDEPEALVAIRAVIGQARP